MKKIITLSLLLSALTLCSCGLGGGNAATGAKQERQANEIIEYYNNSLDVLKKFHSDKDMDRVIEYMEKRQKRGNTIAPIFGVTFYRDSSKVTNPGSCFSKDVRSDLQKFYRAFFADGQLFMDNYEKYKAYVKAEDYKDDNWGRGRDLLAENVDIQQRINLHRSNIYEIITPLADAAEEITLIDNPIREHILTGKSIFDAMENILYYYDEADVEEIDANYDILEGLVKQARALEPVPDHDRQMKSFGEFIDKTESFMGEVRKLRREGRYNERGYKSLMSEYEYAISRYNNFVN